MDRLYASGKSVVWPLHCIPVILKDNYDTADMPTTGGARTAFLDRNGLRGARIGVKREFVAVHHQY